MFGTQNLGFFLLSGITLNLIPGQDTLYIVGRSLSQGRTAGIVSVLGISSGCLFHITAVAVGLYSVLAVSPVLFTLICLAGGFYLLSLGIRAITSDSHGSSVRTPEFGSERIGRIYRQGLTTNLLNPKVALFFITFLPQFIDPSSNYGAFSFLFLGSIFLCTGTIWCFVVALSASAFADALRDNPGMQPVFDRVAGLLYIGLGISIFWTHYARFFNVPT